MQLNSGFHQDLENGLQGCGCQHQHSSKAERMVDHSNVPVKGSISELDSSENDKLRSFEMTLCVGDQTHAVQVTNLGASILQYRLNDVDMVLGYKGARDMQEQGNPVFFGAVVGRVANRIREGRLHINEKTYELECNNPPNHLHGGSEGYSHKVWEVESFGVVDHANVQIPYLRLQLESPDGDQGYPGNVHITATYSLRPSLSTRGSALRLELAATLDSNETLSTPINLAQHSYWNLAPEDLETAGVLDHKLSLHCDTYTPIDETQIPTRQIQSLKDDPTMQCLTQETTIRQAIHSYGIQTMHLPEDQVQSDLTTRQPSKPYGLDHNFVVCPQEGVVLPHVATLSCHQRSLSVFATAPGVQVYSGNYLNPNEQNDEHCKAPYRPWSGVCLETQHFPDSIPHPKEPLPPDFAKGQCPILSPSQPNYQHVVEYVLHSTLEDGTGGSDTAGRSFPSIETMWANQDLANWYQRSSDYYESNCDTTVDGVLGGIGWISDTDLEGSRKFIQGLPFPDAWQKADMVACECGAGIGRVTKGLLLELCGRSDLVESSSRLLYSAPDYIGPQASRCRFFCSELQDWKPAKDKYALIWAQWVLIYLTDNDLVNFLIRLRESLRPGGYIVLKENTCVDSEAFVVDVDDASMTRSLPYWKDLIFQAGLRVVRETWQDDFPDDIFPVPMLALQPIEW